MSRCLLFLFLFLSFVSHAQTNNPKGPIITFRNPVFDFGIYREGPRLEHEFVFTNTGNEPLIIRIAQTSDPHVASWPKEPILPGKTGVIKVTLDSRGRIGPFYKPTWVMSNAINGNHYSSGESRSEELIIKGQIIMDTVNRAILRLTTNEVYDFDTVARGAILQHDFYFTNYGGITTHFVKAEYSFPSADTASYSVSFDTTAILPYGRGNGHAHAYVNTADFQGYFYKPVTLYDQLGNEIWIYLRGYIK